MNSKKNKASLNASTAMKSVMIITLFTGKLFLSSLSATEDSSNQIKNQAIYIYNKAMEAVKDAKNSGQTNKEISNIYIHYAGKSRDAGHHVYAKNFFKTALEIDPNNARGHRIYGDYLMGYRGTAGQYEYASYHYYQAQKLFDKESSSDSDKERKRLSRSIDIMYRDGKDGIPLHRSDKFSAFLKLSTAYKKNTPSIIGLLDTQNRIERFTDSNPLNPWNAFFENAPKDLVRRQETKEFNASLLTRFGNPSLPYLRIAAERAEIDKPTILVDDPAPRHTQGTFNRTVITFGKNGFLPYTIDWNTELEFDWRTIQVEDPLTKNEIEKEDTNAITGRVGFAKFFPDRLLKFNLSGSLLEIDNNGSSDDAGNQANVSIRYSIFPEPEENIETNERFRGRRSTHFEGGIQRTERIYKPLAKEIFYQPFLSYEEFGLAEGKLDLVFLYKYILRDFEIKNTSSILEGNFHAHEFTIMPIWIPVYELYDYKFRTGLEHMTINFPFKVTFGDGKYDRVSFATKLFQRWTFNGFAIEASGTVDYNFYTVTSESDWGAFLEFSLLSGAY